MSINPETFEPLALIDVDWSDRSVYHYHNDPNGCPTRLTDADGEVKWWARYAAWGGVAEVYVEGGGESDSVAGAV